MKADKDHLGEELDLLIDGRLAPERRAQVEAHLEGCARCRRQLDALRSVKAALHRMREPEVSQTLAGQVTSALDRVDRESARRSTGAYRVARPLALGFGLAAAAALVVLLLRVSGDDFITAAAEDLAKVRAQSLPMDLATSDPTALERFFAESRREFAARVFDFGMMGYQLIGGRVHTIEGRQSALFVYRNEGGRLIVCQMFEGWLNELPVAEEERENDGIRFRVYRAGNVTLVFWQEGTVVCVLASDGDPEEAIQLAFAKAIRVPAPGG